LAKLQVCITTRLQISRV